MSKKQQAEAIYAEMTANGTLSRKAFIERMVKEVGMTPAGASTYYVNCKNVAEGKGIKSYYKPKSERATSSTGGTDKPDDSKQDAPLWSLVVADGLVVTDGLVTDGKVSAVHAFMSEEAAVNRFKRLTEKGRARCVVVSGLPKEGDSVTSLSILMNPQTIEGA